MTLEKRKARPEVWPLTKLINYSKAISPNNSDYSRQTMIKIVSEYFNFNGEKKLLDIV